MAQQPSNQGSAVFVHHPKPGRTSFYGARTYSMVCSGIDVSRHTGEISHVGLTLRAHEGKTLAVVTRTLTAPQCEDLARALIDAAAEIRHAMAAAAAQDAAVAEQPATAEGGAA